MRSSPSVDAHGLKPHRLKRWNGSLEPETETKAADILRRFIEAPGSAVVLCVDEKTPTQPRERTDPVLPLRPGRSEGHGFAHERRVARSLYAALDVGTGHI